MILPIIAYGNPVLKKEATEISKEYPNYQQLLENMFETMYNAHGVGLAAPQIGLSIRVFIVDTRPFSDDDELSKDEQKQLQDFKKVFINAKIVKEEGEEWAFNEGCLSIPDLREEVYRKPSVTITYLDESFTSHTDTFDGLIARVIQHEYDHIEGVLFTDKLSAFKKRLIKGRLSNISKGKIDPGYKMRFQELKKKHL